MKKKINDIGYFKIYDRPSPNVKVQFCRGEEGTKQAKN